MKLQSSCADGTELEVAPLAGAWIEIAEDSRARAEKLSPPSRGRGLKCFVHTDKLIGDESPPSRGRGLKCIGIKAKTAEPASPPSRGRGLK